MNRFAAGWCLCAGVLAVAVRADESAPNVLSRAERAAGWTLLFDGAHARAWRAYRSSGFPDRGWTIEDGCLKTVANAKGAPDLITSDQYGDFELSLEWKVAAKGNSGIIYRVSETLDATWQTGPEYQILDDAGHDKKPGDPHSAGALYDLAPPSADKVVRPAGEFNHSRVVVSGGRVEHWLNGALVVDLRTDGEDWKQRIAASKFRDYSGFGVQPVGHIGLQHHGGDVWFRNIKIRDLGKPMPGEVALFNGRDLSGWTPFLPDGGDPTATWRVADGILVCSGTPTGYVRTSSDYTNYVLRMEWRFSPVTKQAGNSGVLLRTQPPDKVWPKCLEAQLQSGSAGDFWNIGEIAMKTDPSRLEGRRTRHIRANERPVGEWNEYEIIVDGEHVTLTVNGAVLNEAWDVPETAGSIALQSEGAEIHFRNVRLAPIE